MALTISDHWFPVLQAAGLAGENTARVVIDLRCGHVPVVHIERFGDDKLLEVIRTLEGVEVVRETPPPHREPCTSKPDEPETYHGIIYHEHACMHDATQPFGTTLEHECRCGKKWIETAMAAASEEPTPDAGLQ